MRPSSTQTVHRARTLRYKLPTNGRMKALADRLEIATATDQDSHAQEVLA